MKPNTKKSNFPDLEITYKIIAELIGYKSISELLNAIISQVRMHLKVDIISIMLIDEKTNTMSIKAAYGLEKRIVEGVHIKQDEGIAGWVMRNQQPLLVKDIKDDERFSPSPFAFHYHAPSLICVPLIVSGTFIGVMNVNNKEDGKALSEDDLHFCTILASFAALSFEKIRLFNEFKEEAARYEQTNQDLIKVNNQLIAFDKRRTRFISAIAHELNTPLTAIKGFGEMLARPELPETKMKTFISMINSEINRLIALTSSLLDISRYYNNKVTINKSQFKVKEFFQKVTGMLHSQAAEKNITFFIDLVDQEIMIYADYDKMMQVMINLITNSIKYAKDGVIVLAAWKENSRSVCLSVRDQGIGIPSDDIPNIFEEFYRIQIHQELGIKGTGLGLSLVKSIIDAHNGKIDVTSKVNDGTCFTITLNAE